MTPYSQKDPRWSSKKLGNCSDTIGMSGCFITCLGMMDDKRPDLINEILRDNGGYLNGCRVNSVQAAILLGIEYNGKSSIYPNYICIAETNHYSPSYPQHFFILKPDGHIIDPLIGYETTNHYNIVSYRLFRAEGEQMGFSDGHIKSLTEHAFRRARVNVLGKVDETGLKADLEARFKQIQGGSIHAIGEMIDAYFKAKDLQWVKKTDYTSLEKKYKQLLMQKEQVDEAYLKCQKDLKICQGKECPPKDCTADIMAEKSLRKVCEDTLKGKIDPKDCPPVDIDDLSAGELITLIFRRIFKR